MQQEAYEKGVQHFWFGIDLNLPNPYPVGSERYKQYEKGWEDSWLKYIKEKELENA